MPDGVWYTGEKDCIIVHGSSRFLKERLYDQSDPYEITICNTCRNIATTKTECRLCNNTDVTDVVIPYATKLLFQELNAMGIKTLFEPDK